MSTEITRSQSGSDDPVRPYPPTTDWVSLGGSVKPQNLISPIYLGGKIYAFARASNDQLKVCTILGGGTAGNWTTYNSYSFYASPTASPVAAVAGVGADSLGVAFLNGQTNVQVCYISPADLTQPKGQVSISGGLPVGTYFVGPVQLVRNENGYLEAFALDNAGSMWWAGESDHKTPATWGKWKQIPAAQTLDVTVKEFKAFLLEAGASQGSIQVVALGSDGKMYQSTETPGTTGNNGSYSSFALLGEYKSVSSNARFVQGLAVTFDPTISGMVYAAYNENPLQTNLPMDYLLGISSSPAWEFVSGFKDTTPNPLLALTTTEDKATHLIWLGGKGQVYLVSRNDKYQTDPTTYWPSDSPQSVGTANPSFTGNLTAVVNENKVGLFQPRSDGAVGFINFLPAS